MTRGMLRKKLYVLISKPLVAPDELKPLLACIDRQIVQACSRPTRGL